MTAAELAEDARELTVRARALRLERQRERAALDGPAIRLLRRLAESPPPPIRAVPSDDTAAPSAPPAERLVA